MRQCLNLLQLCSNHSLCFPSKRKPEVSFFKEFIDLRKFWRLLECVAEKVLFKLYNYLVIICLDSIIEIQVRHIGTNQNQVTLHKTGNVLSNMTDTCYRLN